ncbi:mycoredoxin [Nocardia arthritidis]|uniref:Mycoredoxin n=2 Tax=Nocardia arthritidis TaxID=228602 RepID=A0A6G9YPB5_9NOCA|nr:mycoredoxin [Nocardia arthritidis]
MPDGKGGRCAMGAVAVFVLGLAWRAGRRAVVACVAVSLVQAGAGAVSVLTVRHAVATVTGAREAATALLVPAAVLAGAALVSQTLSGIASYLQAVLGERTAQLAVRRVMVVAAAAELIRYEDPRFHDRVVRAHTTANTYPRTVVQALLSVMHTAIYGVAVAASVAVLAWMTVPLLLLAVLPMWLEARRSNRRWYELAVSQSEITRSTMHLETMLTDRGAAAEIRAFAAGPTLLARWQDLRTELLTEQIRLQRITAVRMTIARAAGVAVMVVLVAVLAVAAESGVLTLATASAVVVAVQLLMGQLTSVATTLSMIGRGRLFLTDLMDFTELPAARPAPPPHAFRTLAAHRLGFTYPGAGTAALTDIELELRAGEVVALVGYNGSGKTTLTKILAGLYPPTTGRLSRDGQPLSDADRPSLCASATLVPQTPGRYPLSATDNIGFGAERPDPAAVAAAADNAGIHRHLAGLPDGYDTILSKERSGGTDLSGGQWQKIAIARGFYRDTPLLILDEPTTGLDPAAEADIYHRLRALYAGHTIVLVTHRLANIRDVDRIYVLDNGRITESGTHDELIARRGAYHRLYTLQAAAYQTPRANGTGADRTALNVGVTDVNPTLTMYSTTWCGYCRRLKKQLEEAGISYVEIDIEQDPASAEFVGSVNGGNHVVPTVKYADGSTATNPSLAQVKQALAAMA